MWVIETTDTFDAWFNALDDTDRTNMLASIMVLQKRGPMLSRPYADTVYGSSHSNMKELRVQSKGKPLRAFFAFDPNRKGIVLCGGSKTGKDKRFYDAMVPIADREFKAYLKNINKCEE
ncbi:hypothetical protein Rin_00008950 [Candidatus Regiella insecticola 5.15]|uniref:Diaminopimelate decarboxylase n=1 Tax=Candidatus Regiella insecticola 5.15 TaxID=1005043 RepID=G2GYN5_9ENTR|nr:type II toxin-antitoxin system RelE/ParE family toxin [Candidatus Regiella insecticola]EGY29147.1 hypothetical protein Rin_00008950 [Candidatus Regiella insecticola 5.15]